MEKRDLENQPMLEHVAQPRLVQENRFNIRRHNVGGLLFVRDLFHTLLSIHPALIFAVLVLVYFSIAALYATYYFVVLESVQDSQVSSYGRALIASLQIQSTIGFAAPGMDHWARNWRVIIGITLQSITTVLFNIFLLGTLFARLSSARNRAISVRVSSVAVVGGEGECAPFLEFRVGEIRKHQLMNLSVSAFMFSHKGEKKFVREKLGLTPPNGIFLAVPNEIRHEVDETSPLWHLLCAESEKMKSFECWVCGDGFRDKSQLMLHVKYEIKTHQKALKELSDMKSPSLRTLKSLIYQNPLYWEIVLLIEGTEPVTGSPIQVRQSFTVSDLRFDQKFKKCWRVEDHAGLSKKRVIVDFDNFDKTE